MHRTIQIKTLGKEVFRLFLIACFITRVSLSEAKNIMLQQSEYNAYLYMYFSGDETRLDDQQIYFAVSKDGLTWDDLNENNPVLTSVLGDQSVRDPFILRTPEGNHFYLIATDLDIRASKYNGNWGLMATEGSNSIMVWESDDLVNWSEQRMVDVSSAVLAGNTWAPEAIYDETEAKYMVFWSSRVATDNYAKHRIYAAYTPDFATFSDPFVYVDTPNGTIDASIHKIGDTFYRLIKDDIVLNVSLSSSNELVDPNSTYASGNAFVKIQNTELESYTGGYEGPTMFQFNGEDKWCVLVDEYVNSRRGYIPFISDDISAPNSLSLMSDGEYLMPTGAKHGTVIPITQEEYDALIAKWAVKAPDETIVDDPVLNYDFNETLNNALVVDKSGNQHNALVYGNATYVNDAGKGQVLYLDGSSETYLAFPQGFFDGRSKMTVSMDIKPESDANYHFTFTVGLNTSKYMFLRTRDNEIRNAITTQSYSKEGQVLTNGSFKGKWVNVKIVMDDHLMSLYLDNTLVDSNAFVRSVSDLGTNLIGYLGKSFYADPYFKGYFDNVRVYNRAFTAEEISSGLSTGLDQPQNKNTNPIAISVEGNKMLVAIENSAELNSVVKLLDITGKTIVSKDVYGNADNCSLDIPDGFHGVCIVSVKTGSQQRTQKVVIP
ncbi:LamG-like jellyroll fold domain-containing protein [Saccharicrinis sp. FJH2]|uniref:LamG-like jellyroll fold domain-containing protein n=1 Tax=Saccharicrinis sp. FJH65 TaxID=3344659 RepID=UPI0035F2B9A5